MAPDNLSNASSVICEQNNHGVVYSFRSSEKRRYDFSQPYPFILVNVGSGVSVLAVYGPSNYKRISGTR